MDAQLSSGVRLQVLYYALGAGVGHITRAAAILRQLRRLGYTNHLVVTNALTTLPLQQERIRFVQFNESAIANLRREVQHTLRQMQPALFIVDAFPRGYVDELTDILPTYTGRKIYLYQRLKAPYQEQLADSALYDEVWLAETPDTTFSCETLDCCPLLLRNAEELLPRADARHLCQVTDDEPLVLAVGTGSASWEADFFATVQRQWHHLRPNAHLRFASLRETIPGIRTVHHYPLVELLSGMDIVIGACGYHLFHEAQTSGASGIFIPQDSEYDDQQGRAHDACMATDAGGLALALERALRESRRSTRQVVTYSNGAIAAARRIEHLMPSLLTAQ